MRAVWTALELCVAGAVGTLDLSSASPSLGRSGAQLVGGELLVELAGEGAEIGAVGYELTGVEGIADSDIIMILVVGWPADREATRKSGRRGSLDAGTFGSAPNKGSGLMPPPTPVLAAVPSMSPTLRSHC